MKTLRDENADLSEHIVYLARWYAVTFEVDEPYLLESIYNFICCFPLLKERACMTVFAEVD